MILTIYGHNLLRAEVFYISFRFSAVFLNSISWSRVLNLSGSHKRPSGLEWSLFPMTMWHTHMSGFSVFKMTADIFIFIHVTSYERYDKKEVEGSGFNCVIRSRLDPDSIGQWIRKSDSLPGKPKWPKNTELQEKFPFFRAILIFFVHFPYSEIKKTNRCSDIKLDSQPSFKFPLVTLPGSINKGRPCS